MTDNRPVIAAAADLLFASRIRAAADVAGVPVEMVRSAAALLERAAAARLILLDLDTRWLLAADTIAALKTDPSTAAIPVVAFVSHVRTDAIEEARLAGADRVLARSAFVRELPELLKRG